MASSHPTAVIIAGPNGAGKSTSAPALLKDTLGVMEFVNVDTLAAGLSAFNPAAAAAEAAGIMLRRLRALVTSRRPFAFETTLSARSYAPFVRDIQAQGYHVHLVFLYLSSEALAVRRVAQRVRAGGHDVPTSTIKRRYRWGLANLFRLYLPLTDTWEIYDNSTVAGPRRIASGNKHQASVADVQLWKTLSGEHG